MAGQLKVVVDKNYITNQIKSAISSVKVDPIQIDLKINTGELDSLEKRIKDINNNLINIQPQTGGSGSGSNSGTKSGGTGSTGGKKNFEAEKKSLQDLITMRQKELNAVKEYSKFQTALTNKSATAGTISTQITEYNQQLDSFSDRLNQLSKGDVKGLKDLRQEFDNLHPGIKNLTKEFKDFDDTLANNQKWAKTAASIEKVQANMQSYITKNSAIKSNSAYYDEFKQFENLSKTLTTSKDLSQFNAQWSAYTAKVKEAGLAHKSFSDTLKGAFNVVNKYFGLNRIIMNVTSQIKQAVSDLKEYDTILTEIGKVSGQSNAELGNLLQSSYGTANKYGATVEGYLTAIQEMSRAGFRGTHAEQLAELSTLAQSAGNMTAELSNQYLLATNMGYGLKGSAEALNRVLDGQKLIN